MESRLAKRTRVKRKNAERSRKRNIRNKEGLSLPGQEKLRRASKRFDPDDEKGAVVERKREEIYIRDADGEETHGIHRRL